MRHVWIVLSGESGEGGAILGVFARKPTEKAVLALAARSELRPWEKDAAALYWTSPPDWLAVERHPVRCPR